MGTIDSNGNITLPIGDTFSFNVVASGYDFSATDRALFTIKGSDGSIIFQNAYQMANNQFRVDLHNSDTDSLSAGNYQYDVRYVVNPVYDENGAIVDGDVVNTPSRPKTLTLLSVVGNI